MTSHAFIICFRRKNAKRNLQNDSALPGTTVLCRETIRTGYVVIWLIFVFVLIRVSLSDPYYVIVGMHEQF
jgi:hypothetical protein